MTGTGDCSAWRVRLEKAAAMMIPRYENVNAYSPSRLFNLQKPHLDVFMDAARSESGRVCLRELTTSPDPCTRYWAAAGLRKYGPETDHPLALKVLADLASVPFKNRSLLEREMCFYALAALTEFDMAVAFSAMARRNSEEPG